MIGVYFFYFPLSHSDLDKEFVFLDDISLFLPFPQLDEHLPSSEPIVDFADFIHDLVEEEEDSGDGGGSQDSRGKRDSREDTNGAEKRRQGPGRPASKRKSLVEQRQKATSREKRRMRALVRLGLFYISSWFELHLCNCL